MAAKFVGVPELRRQSQPRRRRAPATCPTKSALARRVRRSTPAVAAFITTGPDRPGPHRRAGRRMAEGRHQDLHGGPDRADRQGRSGDALTQAQAQNSDAGQRRLTGRHGVTDRSERTRPARPRRPSAAARSPCIRRPAPASRRRRSSQWLFLVPAVVYVAAVLRLPAWSRTSSMALQDYTTATFFTGEAPWVGLRATTSTSCSSAVFAHALHQHRAVHRRLDRRRSSCIGLALALFFRRRFPLSGFLRSLLLLPWLLPLIVSSAVWSWILDQDSGVLNQFLGIVGIHAVPWLTSTVARAGRRDRGEHLDRHPVQHHDPLRRPAGHPRGAVRGRPPWTAPPAGARSGTSPGRCCGRW